MKIRKSRKATPPDEAFALADTATANGTVVDDDVVMVENGTNAGNGEENGVANQYKWDNSGTVTAVVAKEDVNLENGGDDAPQMKDPEDQEYVHDQLPSVEEAKLNLRAAYVKFGGRTVLLALAVCTLLVLGITALAKISSNKKQHENVRNDSLVDRTEELIKFVRHNEISNEPSLRDAGSPQRRAAQFLADGDLFLEREGLTEDNAEIFVERYVLSVLYYALAGDGWTHQLDFLSDHHHCDWHRTYQTNNGDTVRQGVAACDDKGHVKELNLEFNNLHGMVPYEVRWLGQLNTLRLEYNPGLIGEFPAAVQHMPNLKHVGLQYCHLQGTLPTWLGSLTQLNTLSIGNNKFHGHVPAQLVNLVNLKFLALDNLGLSGSMDIFRNMRQLKTLYLDDNQLSGELTNLIPNWHMLREIDVSNNMLDGHIPATLFDGDVLKMLTVVDLHRNLFYGPFPTEIYQNTNLQYFSIQDNTLTGPLTDRIGFLEGLKHFDVSYNKFNETLPNTIQGLTNLKYLGTSGNQFHVQPFLDLSKLTNLRDLQMKDNALIGRFPEWIGNLSNLKLLNLDHNEISGTIPSWIGLLTELEYLMLNRNELTGTLPHELLRLSKLEVLLVNQNSIGGSAQFICDSPDLSPSYFHSDCYPNQSGQPEIDCRCCTRCCSDENDPFCNDDGRWSSLTRNDPVWEYGFERQSYELDLSNFPAMEQEEQGEETRPVGLLNGE